jgi:uncharacterized damage-inducible protein DinB
VDPEQALEKLDQSRQALFAALEGLDNKDMDSPLVEGDWTIKDVLGHIASWEQTCVEPMRAFSSGADFSAEIIVDHNAWNARQFAQKKDLPLDDILRDLSRLRLEVLAMADKLSDQQWEQTIRMPWGEQGTTAEMLAGLAWHEMEHVQTIQNWKGKHS